jgi:hypothetical protein
MYTIFYSLSFINSMILLKSSSDWNGIVIFPFHFHFYIYFASKIISKTFFEFLEFQMLTMPLSWPLVSVLDFPDSFY